MAEEGRSLSYLSVEYAPLLSVAMTLVAKIVAGITFRHDFVDCIMIHVVVDLVCGLIWVKKINNNIIRISRKFGIRIFWLTINGKINLKLNPYSYGKINWSDAIKLWQVDRYKNWLKYESNKEITREMKKKNSFESFLIRWLSTPERNF